MRGHPGEGQLLEMHFGELEPREAAALSAHVRACAACRAFLDEIDDVERLLAPGPADAPPTDGLERVLARVDASPPAAVRRDPWVRAVLPSAAAVLTGSAVLLHAGPIAALTFFAAGSLVTLALAPVLILETRGTSR